MERVLFYLRIFPGTEAEYDQVARGRARGTPGARSAASGFRNVTGFRRGTDVWWYAETEPDRASVLAKLGPRLRSPRGTGGSRPSSRSGTDADGRPLFYEQIFHTDGGARQGPMSRGLFSLVVAPDRIPYYDQLHAEPWPDMIDALAAAGYSDYTGFRRGNHVVYFGEYFPDIETVVGAHRDDRGERALGQGVRRGHHDHHHGRRQAHHGRRDLPPGLRVDRPTRHQGDRMAVA